MSTAFGIWWSFDELENREGEIHSTEISVGVARVAGSMVSVCERRQGVVFGNQA